MTDELKHVSLITLHDPEGNARHIDALKISEIYHDVFLATPKAESSVPLDGRLRFFLETPEEVARIASEFISLVQFHVVWTLPSLHVGPLYINIMSIEQTREIPHGGTAIVIAGRLGAAQVTEKIGEVQAALQRAGAPQTV